MLLSNQQHYTVLQPEATHFRPATCAETACPHYLLGWVTYLDERTAQGQSLAWDVRHNLKREFKEERLASGLTAFTFHAGQKCFRAHHKKPLDRDAIFLKKLPGTSPQWMYGQDWIDDSKEHLFRLKRRFDRG